MTTLSYKAGRLFRAGSTNTVEANPEKGLLELRDGGDGLLHLFWKSRVSGNASLDLIIFPGDASFSKVPSSGTDNVFVLNFESSGEKHFFWFQTANAPYDRQASNIQSLIDDPEFVPTAEDASTSTAMPAPSSSSNAAASSYTASTSAVPATPAHQQAVSSSAGAAAPQAPNPRRTVGFDLSTGAADGQGYSPEQLAQLQAILEGQVAPSTEETDISLPDLLTPQLLAPILTSPSLRASLFPHLPSDLPLSSSTPTEAELQSILESAPFQEGVRSLDRALRTGALGGLVQGLGLPAEAGTGVEAFLKAVGEQGKKASGGSSGPEGDDAMETD